MESAVSVLIVEDSPELRRSIVESLLHSGFVVGSAENPEAADALLNQGTSFDIVVSDLDMPGRSGIQFFQDLQRRGVSVPFILMTGSFIELKTVLDFGISDLLRKPFSAQILRDSIFKYVASKRAS